MNTQRRPSVGRLTARPMQWVPLSAIASFTLLISACGGGEGGTNGATSSTSTSVPNVVGDTQASATTALNTAGFVVGTVSQQSSGTVASGSVISESPAAGANVANGSPVSLVISSGKPLVAVPDVVGDAQASATSAVTGAGLVVGTVTQQSSSTIASGGVISESPAAGADVANGSAVNLVLSSGKAAIAVPNVVGDTQASATSVVTGAGLVVGTVTQQSSSTVASGSVISESPAAGTDVASGSAVALVISSGPAAGGGYTVSGTVSGLVSGLLSSLVLTDGTATASPTGTGFTGGADPFAFAPLPTGTAYSISVVSQPSGYTCAVTQGASGTITTSNITNVTVVCGAGTWVALNTYVPSGCSGVSVAALNGVLYVLGGQTGTEANPVWCDNLESYDPGTNTWTELKPYPLYVSAMALVGINNKLYSFGGFFQINNGGTGSLAYSYDPTANQWTEIQGTAGGTSESAEGQLAGMGVTTDGTLAYLVGGEFVGTSAGAIATNGTTVTYDPGTNQYAVLPFSAALQWPAVGWISGNLVVAPGWNFSQCESTPGAPYYINYYNISSQDSYISPEAFPPGTGCGAVSYGAVIGNTLYISAQDLLASYDITTNSWITLAPPPCSGNCLGPLAAIGSNIYVISNDGELWQYLP
jgi:beta-lactam-binding protein with PASTA domain